MGNFAEHFSLSLKHHKTASGHTSHFAAHSHHPWPDASLAGQKQAWQDAAVNLDDKWDTVFGTIVPDVQKGIAARIGLNEADSPNICFAPNTHELVNRLLSCLPENPTIISSDSEFHSFNRQMTRLQEESKVKWIQVPSEPFNTYETRLKETLQTQKADMIFLSHTLFNSGYIMQDLEGIIDTINDSETFVVIDGYHSFMALPIDWNPFKDRAFFLSGGYKYAMSGEGCCFMYCPNGYGMRPRNTGWYASFGTLQVQQNKREVPYAEGGMRFMGATFDPSGLYRMRSVFKWMDEQNITPQTARTYTQELQEQFVKETHNINLGKLVNAPGKHTGQFLTYESPNSPELYQKLKEQNILTDVRGERIRFGFGIYHTSADVSALSGILHSL